MFESDVSEERYNVSLIDHACEEHHYNHKSAQSIGCLGKHSLFEHGSNELQNATSHTNIGYRNGEGTCGTEATKSCN